MAKNTQNLISQFALKVSQTNNPYARLDQSQISLTDQMKELADAAFRLGLYDAQDWLLARFVQGANNDKRS